MSTTPTTPIATTSSAFEQRRGQIETYFDRTAAAAWARLTSTEKLSRVRETVRAGRDRMRALLLASLPQNLTGHTVLDAGSGTGAMAVALAARGARVTAVDLSPTLMRLAQDRAGTQSPGTITYVVGDMTDPALGRFDHIVGMDSLIHYEAADVARSLANFAARAGSTIAFTFAPRTALLSVMHGAGKLFPRGDRAPAIVPVAESALRRHIAAAPALAPFTIAQTERVKSGFYISQAMVLRRGTA